MSLDRRIVDQALAKYSEILNTKPPENPDDDPLRKFYNEKSKLTDGDRKMGAKNIVEQLRREQREITFESYSTAEIDEKHIIITGQCLIGNNRTSFTIALECDENYNVFISNQIMNL
ncbi:hypothetical protein TRFO_40285 [Tritrichomonas foetus]|uniref:NTF2 domain-containing protein n=1 Tax=Tritrichomonas foetus TaxID=1144522 RepID=A0A1J4J5N5_9EUKA|nr:hypothetical protein TRFO_40285 [Tritrichomonas foetus]|eukprot:OHS93447.1 hypothetical protein TRFO_40285 [Tritrichomonas foetus]